MLKLTNVKKHYQQFTLDCSLEVKSGKITGLIGQNGAGKSTTFKAILNLIQKDSGVIELFGKDVQKLDMKDKEKIGVVLSDSGFSGYLTIGDIVPVLSNLYKKFNKVKFLERCQQFGLPKDKKIKEFSTGMQAKLKVLVALSHDAQFLILDEPTAGLDPQGAKEMLNLFQKINQQGKTVILVSHDMNQVLEYCDDVVVMNKGRVEKHVTVDELFRETEYLTSLSIDLPMITSFILELNANGYHIDPSLKDINQLIEEIGGQINE